MTLTLLLRFWQPIAIAALALGLVGACHQRDQALKAQGVATERMRVADSTLDALRSQLARVDTVFKTDTQRVVVGAAKVAALHDSLLALLRVPHNTDAPQPIVHDTTIVLRYVAATDSTIKACTDLVQSCAKRAELLSQERDAWKAKALAIPPASAGHSRLVDLGLVALSGAAGYWLRRQ